jgi:hypothetical protein
MAMPPLFHTSEVLHHVAWDVRPKIRGETLLANLTANRHWPDDRHRPDDRHIQPSSYFPASVLVTNVVMVSIGMINLFAGFTGATDQIESEEDTTVRIIRPDLHRHSPDLGRVVC